MARANLAIKLSIAIAAGLTVRFSLVLPHGWVAAVAGLCALCISLGTIATRWKRFAVSTAFLLTLAVSQLFFMFPYAQTHGPGSLLLIPVLALCYGAVFEVLILAPKRISPQWTLLSFLLADFAFCKYPIGSPLMQLGSTAVDIPGIASAYSLVGPFWVTLWIAIIAQIIIDSFLHKPVKKYLLALFSCIPLLCLLQGISKNRERENVKVAMIPIADIKDSDKVAHYIETAAQDGTDIVILPEGIYTFIHPQETVSPSMTKLRRDVKTGKYPTVLMGLWTLAPGRFENAAVSYSKEGVFRRDKVKRIPFGEYVPSGLLPTGLLDNLVPYPVTLRENVDGNVFPSGDVLFCPLICYEALFTDLMAEYVREGAEMFMVLSSNSLINSILVEKQINRIIRMNAAVTSRSVVRCVENGISAFISPGGRIDCKTAFQTGLYEREVSAVRYKSIYVKYSRAIDLLYLLTLIIMSVITINYRT